MEGREEIFLEEFNSKLEFSIIDGGSIRANYGDITRLMQEYSDQQSKPLLEEIERLKGEKDELIKSHDELVRNAAEDYETPKCAKQCDKCKNEFPEQPKQVESECEAVDEMFNEFNMEYYSKLINTSNNNQYATFAEWFKNQNKYEIFKKI